MHWDYTYSYLTLGEAEKFIEQSMPREVNHRCLNHCEGCYCMLYEGHSGNHEAYGLGENILLHEWPNLNPPTSN